MRAKSYQKELGNRIKPHYIFINVHYCRKIQNNKNLSTKMEEMYERWYVVGVKFWNVSVANVEKITILVSSNLSVLSLH